MKSSARKLSPKSVLKDTLSYIKRPVVALVLLLAFILHAFMIMPSGTNFCIKEKCGLFFWGAHQYDGIWHLGLASISFNSFPFQVPSFAGETLRSYNYLLDLVIFLGRFIGLNPLFLYFKFIPLVWLLVFSYLAIRLGNLIYRSSTYIASLLFFLFFGSSFSYFLTLYRTGKLDMSGAISAMQSIQHLTNLQFAVSLIFILILLIFIKKEAYTWRQHVLIAFLVFIIMGLKFYGGVIATVMVGTYNLTALIKKKNLLDFIRNNLLLVLGLALAVVIFYDPFSSLGKSSVFAIKPFSLINPVIEDKSMFYMQNVTLARYYLEAHGSYGPRYFAILALSLSLFIFLNFGTRLIGLILLMSRLIKKTISGFDIVVFAGAVAGVFLTSTLIQRGEDWWNTIQFLYYSFFLMNFFAAEALYKLLVSRKILGIIIACILVIATIPTNIGVLKEFVLSTPDSYISRAELQALQFLRKHPKGTVLTRLFEKGLNEQQLIPSPLFAVDDTVYVGAFSQKPQYLAQTKVLESLGVNYTKRKQLLSAYRCEVLVDIDYIYEQKRYPLKKHFNACGFIFEKIYDNSEVVIYAKK